MILPWFGGAAAVWITCMVFFQLVLLGGYIYAHWLISRLKAKKQITIHLCLLLLSILLLPIAPNNHWQALNNLDPVSHLLYLLLTSVGIPYFLLSTTSPLLQSWYSRTYRHSIPYRLFALSNIASLLGLLAYPFLVEPNLTLSQQSNYWSVAYIIFAVTCVVTALHSAKARAPENLKSAEVANPVRSEPSPPEMTEKILWILLAACASILLLSTTNYLTQNIASFPFLWILPLSLYLFTFTICFGLDGWYRRSWYGWIIAAVLVGMSYALVIVRWDAHPYYTVIKIFIFSAGLFACCMFCHGELAARKPAPKYLTSFYLMISLGGALGGILIGIIVPKVLPGPFEFAIALNGCALLLFLVNLRQRWTSRIIFSALVFSVIITGGFIYLYINSSQLVARNFYGCLRVNVYDKGTNNEYRCLVNGTIIHGIQFQCPKRRREPLSYFSPASGVGLAIKNLPQGTRRVGIIGLGVGSLLGYARQGDYYHYYEINPLVKDVAQKEFSFISGCPSKVDISIGDGRLLLEQESDQPYDLLVVDAFSGDSIPVHLLTVEAVRLYFRHLKPKGILALHISNAYLNLAPVVEQIRSTLGKQAILISNKGGDKIIYDSEWVLMTTNRNLMTIPEIKKVAVKLESKPNVRVWTDDYSNLLQIMKFKKVVL